jgi:hypothetical protein
MLKTIFKLFNVDTESHDFLFIVLHKLGLVEVDQFKLFSQLFVVFHTDHGVDLIVEFPDEFRAFADLSLELFDSFLEADDLEFGFDGVVVLFEGLDAGGDEEGLRLPFEVKLFDVLSQRLNLGFGLSPELTVFRFELAFGCGVSVEPILVVFEFFDGGFFCVGEFGLKTESILFEVVLVLRFDFEVFLKVIAFFVVVFELVGEVGVALFELLDEELERGGFLFELMFLFGGVDFDGL